MPKLRSKMVVPPYGWFYIQDGIKLDGGTFKDTVSLITKHRKSNNIPIGNPELDLIDYTCSRAPQYCDFNSNERTNPQSHPSLSHKGSDFLGIYTRWARMGFLTVDQIDANYRANTCWKCPANQKVKQTEKHGCCGKTKEFATKVSRYAASALTWPATRNKVTPADNELYTCSVCGCPNKVSVWLPRSVFNYDKNMENNFKSANSKCWKVN